MGTFSSGLREIDEGQVYSLMRTAQILAGNQSLVNEIRVHLNNTLDAGDVAEPDSATNRLPGSLVAGRPTPIFFRLSRSET